MGNNFRRLILFSNLDIRTKMSGKKLKFKIINCLKMEKRKAKTQINTTKQSQERSQKTYKERKSSKR